MAKKATLAEVQEPAAKPKKTQDSIASRPIPKKKSTTDMFRRNLNKNKPWVFKLLKKSSNPTIKGRHYPVSLSIPVKDTIFDPETGTNRQIHYLPGEASIFVDEQSKEAQKTKSSIIFKSGTLMVKRVQPNLHKYLTACNWFAGNENRMPGKTPIFKLDDVTRDIEKEMSDIDMQYKAMGLALNSPAEKLLAFAKVVGVNIDRPMVEIRHDLKILADRNPSHFITQFENPRLDRKLRVMMALEYGVIGKNTQMFHWKSGGKNTPIVNIPMGKNAVDFFTDFTYEKEGDVVFKEIDRMLTLMIEG